MMNHAKCVDREQLFAFAHHLLDQSEEEVVREHVERCAACGQTVAEYRTLDSLLDEWKPAGPSAWFDARVRAAVARDESAQSSFAIFGLRWAQVLTLACVMALVVVASIIVSRPGEVNSLQSGSEQAAAHQNSQAARQVEEELTLYKDLPVLEDEDYDMLANFDVLSAVPRGNSGENKVEN